MAYTIDSAGIRLEVRTDYRPHYDDQGRLTSNTESTNLYAVVPFTYLNKIYTETVLVATMYTVDRDLATGLLILSTMTVVTPTATVDKTFVDAAIASALAIKCATIDIDNEYERVLAGIRNYTSYGYDVESTR